MTTLTRAGSATLDAPAAAAYLRALAAGAPDSVTSSYRDPDEQMRLYTGWVNKVAGFNFALHPDKSDHCKGLAIDLSGAAAKAWFRANGQAYGWVFTDKSEDWHIAYRASYDQHLTGTVSVTPIATREWDQMATKEEFAALMADSEARIVEAVRQSQRMFLRDKKGRIVMLTGTGARTLTGAEWKHWNTGMGYKLDQDGIDADSLTAIIASTGGAVR